MENKNKKCFSTEHKEIDAISFCLECNIYMCNKCENLHSKLFNNHHSYKLDKDFNEIFTGLCKYKNHKNEYEFFCKTHNELCCAVCISKIKKEGKGQHTDCDVCLIEDIKNEKKNKFNENIKKLENLSNKIDELINQLKIIFEKINKDKEKIKLKIQNIFTKIRNTINDREDELLYEVDKKYGDTYFNENIIKDCEKLPNKIKISLENGKKMNEKWNEENKLNLLINDCISIENNINEINLINVNITKCQNLSEIKINFYPEEENEIQKFLETIKNFGTIRNLYYFNGSNILNNNDEKLLIEWLPLKPKKINLLLNSNKDGDTIKIFSEKIKDKSPTLVIIMSKDGYKFGGYTTQQWKKGANTDNNAFVFSLDKKMKYKILNPKNATYLDSWWGFGPYENAIVIYDKCTTNNSGNYIGNGTYDIKESYVLNGGKQYFTVKSFEVYHMEF